MDTSLPTLQIFKALSDECRLRMIRAISQAELSVAELVRVLGMPQSTVSRHLKPLRESGLLETRRNGTSVFYHKGTVFSDPELNQVIDRSLEQLPGANEDRASVRLVLDERTSRNRDFFDDLAGRYGSLTEPGGGWSAISAALSIGFTGKRVADIGAGEGDLTMQLARFTKQVVAVDLSPRMLMTLRTKAEAAGLGDRVMTLEGELEKLPIEDNEMDVIFISQALHHAAQPPAAIKEAARCLCPGGRLVILDLVSHDQEWVREQYADIWLGFDPDELKSYFQKAELICNTVARLPGATPDLPVLLMTATKTQ